MSNTHPSPSQADDRQAVLLDLAKRLRQKREAQQLSLEDVAYKLKIRSPYLVGFETGDWGELPEDVYALGFLRQYASFLEEDISNDIANIKNETIKLTRPLTFPDPSISPNKSWVIIALLTFIVLFITFNVFDDDQPTIKTTVVHPPAEQTPTVQTLAEKTITPQATEEVMQKEQAMSILPKLSPTVEVIKDTPVVPAVQTGKHLYRFHATDADVWMQLSQPKSSNSPKRLVREVLLKSGESFSVRHDSAYLLLNCGNSLALEVEINGQPVPLFNDPEKQQKVVQNLVLRAVGKTTTNEE